MGKIVIIHRMNHEDIEWEVENFLLNRAKARKGERLSLIVEEIFKEINIRQEVHLRTTKSIHLKRDEIRDALQMINSCKDKDASEFYDFVFLEEEDRVDFVVSKLNK